MIPSLAQVNDNTTKTGRKVPKVVIYMRTCTTEAKFHRVFRSQPSDSPTHTGPPKKQSRHDPFTCTCERLRENLNLRATLSRSLAEVNDRKAKVYHSFARNSLAPFTHKGVCKEHRWHFPSLAQVKRGNTNLRHEIPFRGAPTGGPVSAFLYLVRENQQRLFTAPGRVVYVECQHARSCTVPSSSFEWRPERHVLRA